MWGFPDVVFQSASLNRFGVDSTSLTAAVDEVMTTRLMLVLNRDPDVSTSAFGASASNRTRVSVRW